jgi:hypothetical protein
MIIDRLKIICYYVKVVGDTASQTGDAAFASLVVTSSSVGSGNVGNKFRDVPFPVLNWEQGLADNYLMTLDQDAVTRGTTATQTQLDIVNPTHPLAAGLSGVTTVASTATDFSWGIPGTNAIIVAKIVGSTNQAAIYAFEKGAALIDGTLAPARRVHAFMTDNSYAPLNDNGKALVDAAINWALGKSSQGGQPQLSISRNANQLTITWTNGGTLQFTDALGGAWTSTGDSDGSFTVDLSAAGASAHRFYRVAK